VRNIRENGRLRKTLCIGCLWLILAALPAYISPQGTGENIPTNFDIVDQISSEAISELLQNMPSLSANDMIILNKEKGVGEIDFVFENALHRLMEDADIDLMAANPSELDTAAAGADYRLSFQLIQLELAYTKIHRPYWFGAKQVTREAEAAVFAKLIDLRSGDVVWVGDTDKKYKDTIAHSMLGTVEDEQYEFTKPPRKEVRWSRIVEPIIVTGIVVGLVYLFFSNQSDE
jgi:hypothetical protein